MKANRLKKKSLRTERKLDDKRGTNPNSLANLKPFVPGISGNPGGRPKLLSEAYREWLAAIDPETGRTNAQLVAQAQGEQSILGETTAAKELRQATEGEKIRTWEDDVADLVRDGKATLDDVRTEFGNDAVARIAARAGLSGSKSASIHSTTPPSGETDAKST